ncbi:tripartite tricarboxylate transporter substrate binding protein [uncultured Sphaerochaeta sp.]|uniref:tripartite tricarboxylate transporter substrate binding protein n=1 Tax=uncultured Sphaerochaeta sp. TaxID=886478 RepID=UPI002A0A9F1A|nr:tripartite tricarboxylate transporter substrate binding protein [uncultured Sphaerochaeta sp.]
MKKRLVVLMALLLCLGTLFANGEIEKGKDTSSYPEKVIKIIVPYGAGGGADITVRLFSKYLEPILGQNIVIQNVTGGSGTIGWTQLINAKPDGYTLGYGDCLMSNGKLLFDGVQYDNSSFTPISKYASDPHIIVVSKSSGITSMDDLIAKAKENPGKMTFGLGGAWSSHDFLRISLEEKTGIKFNRMVFQSGAAAVNAVAGGNCDVAVPFTAEALAQIEAGNVMPLAITSSTRFAIIKDIPTLKELGFDFEHVMWRALVGPAGIPEAIIKILDKAMAQVLTDPEYQAQVLNAGSFALYEGYDTFKDSFNTSHEFYKKMILETSK